MTDPGKNHERAPGRRGSAWFAVASMLTAACLAAPASASDAAHSPAPSAPTSGKPVDPLSLIGGSAESWSVSRTDAGCYLISPHRAEGSRLAIGQHPVFGLGLLAVSLRLSLPRGTTDEPVTIQADGQELKKIGRISGTNVVFVALDRAEAEASLQELGAAGTLWLMVRHTWIAHGGRAVQAAIAEYGRVCADAGRAAG